MGKLTEKYKKELEQGVLIFLEELTDAVFHINFVDGSLDGMVDVVLEDYYDRYHICEYGPSEKEELAEETKIIKEMVKESLNERYEIKPAWLLHEKTT